MTVVEPTPEELASAVVLPLKEVRVGDILVGWGFHPRREAMYVARDPREHFHLIRETRNGNIECSRYGKLTASTVHGSFQPYQLVVRRAAPELEVVEVPMGAAVIGDVVVGWKFKEDLWSARLGITDEHLPQANDASWTVAQIREDRALRSADGQAIMFWEDGLLLRVRRTKVRQYANPESAARLREYLERLCV